MNLQSILHDLIREFGVSVLNERKRLLGLMADRFPKAKKEKQLLSNTFEAGIVESLKLDGSVHSQLLAIKCLEEDWSLKTESARMMVESLANALGYTLHNSDLNAALSKKFNNKLTDSAKCLCLLQDHPLTPEMVVVPAGKFMMGGNRSVDELPIHRVKVSQFAFGKTPVTQLQWKVLMGNNPSYFQGDGCEHCPVECVSWDDIQEYIIKLNTLTGHRYRLPSEAEWEYACRAGCKEDWCFGNDESQLTHFAWCDKNSDRKTHPVAQKRSNAFGLYDIYGNVWEWVQDCWKGDYEGAPKDGSARLTGDSGRRVVRGGSWDLPWLGTRSSLRLWHYSTCRRNDLGFRIAMSLS